MDSHLLSQIEFLYGSVKARSILNRVEKVVSSYRNRIEACLGQLTERDSILITYADQVQTPGEKPLKTLNRFCKQYLKDTVSGIHILPFYPWTSDDGFSVLDYRQVESNYGDWEDISALLTNFRLMFDAVINHISAHSEWFQKYLRDDIHYRDFFISVNGTPDLSHVVRPRALPLLTKFETESGDKKVWTTFSDDQIDLNYRNPQVLIDILDILLMYVERGATFIRLDAIAYLWKEPGTTCIHLLQTHRVIQFFRDVLKDVAPHVHLITETNVPHAENISYFGNGYNEAQLVYNFALPPLTLHTLHTGDARALSNWAGTLSLPSNQTTFFNFLSSHDGVGINPVRGILSDSEIDAMVGKALAHGGLISYKVNPDGTQSPYEMNINYFDALTNPASVEPMDVQVDRFMVAQAIMLSLVGLPGIYFHSLFGSRGWPEGVAETGRNRTINREKLRLDKLQNDLANQDSLCSKVFTRFRQLLMARSSTGAFHPHGSQKILVLHRAVFGVVRVSPDGKTRTLCLHNTCAQQVAVSTNFNAGLDIITGQNVLLSNILLEPYQILWVNL